MDYSTINNVDKWDKRGSLGIAVIKPDMAVAGQTMRSLPSQGKCVEKYEPGYTSHNSVVSGL
jgi:hypothetical protein